VLIVFALQTSVSCETILTEAVDGGSPGPSTVYLTQNPKDSFHPCGNKNSHLSIRNGNDLMVNGHLQSREEYTMLTGT
jgi:hypothetical protein